MLRALLHSQYLREDLPNAATGELLASAENYMSLQKISSDRFRRKPALVQPTGPSLHLLHLANVSMLVALPSHASFRL